MTVTVSKSSFGLREAFNLLRRSIGLKGAEVMKANTISDAYTVLNPVMFRNRIINGAMNVNQYNTGTAVTPNSGGNALFPLDRFRVYNDYTSAYLSYQVSTSVVPPGFTHSLGVTTSTAFTNSGNAFIAQFIEGSNIYDLAWGTAYAKSVTLSFWVQSAIPGIYGGALRNGSSNRSYPFTYTIYNASVWQQISITIPGDASGTWATDSTTGISLTFDVGSASSNKGTPGVWSGSNYISATSTVGITGAAGATFYITGIQLEAGTVATPFEYRPYALDLSLCQRYYYEFPNTNGVHFSGTARLIATNNGTNSLVIVGGIYFPTVMRSAPSITYYGGATSGASFSCYTSSGGSQVSGTATVSSTAFSSSTTLAFNGSGQTAAGGASFWIDCGWGSGNFGAVLTAEL